jgi:hypothetical protein
MTTEADRNAKTIDDARTLANRILRCPKAPPDKTFKTTTPYIINDDVLDQCATLLRTLANIVEAYGKGTTMTTIDNITCLGKTVTITVPEGYGSGDLLALAEYVDKAFPGCVVTVRSPSRVYATYDATKATGLDSSAARDWGGT